MSKTLRDFIGKKDLFDSTFVDKEGHVYFIESVSFPQARLSFAERFLNRPKTNYGVASCRLAFGIRYTIPLSEHLDDSSNPSEEEVNASRGRCQGLIEDFGADSAYLVA
jgi:hypothetical protein